MSKMTVSDPEAVHIPFNDAGFTTLLREHRLMAARCTGCGNLYLPPREMCPRCNIAQMEWAALSGMGELIGFTSIAVGLPEMTAEGYNREHPYCVGVVRLAEGPSISGQLIHIDCDHPETIHIGLSVKAAFIERGTGEAAQVRLAFEPH